MQLCAVVFWITVTQIRMQVIIRDSELKLFLECSFMGSANELQTLSFSSVSFRDQAFEVTRWSLLNPFEEIQVDCDQWDALQLHGFWHDHTIDRTIVFLIGDGGGGCVVMVVEVVCEILLWTNNVCDFFPIVFGKSCAVLQVLFFSV